MRLISPFWVPAAAFLLTSFAVPASALAQTATNLQCKGCVGKQDLGKKSVTRKAIGPNAVRGKAIRNNAVTTGKLKDRAVTADKLAPGAKPTGVEFNSAVAVHALTTTLASIQSVTVTAPGPGYIVATASWTYVSGETDAQGFCYLATAPGVSQGPPAFGHSDTPAFVYAVPATLTNAFQVSAGDTTIHLNCREITDDMNVDYPSITALFVPNRY